MAVKRLYEGMFLVDSALATADWEGTVAFIENILKRADAEIVALRKWDERKLAYDVEHKSRGTYILTYFRADTQRIGGIEKDVQLSEKVMRVLILGTEDRPQEMIDRDITGQPAQQEPAPESQETAEGGGRDEREGGEEGEPAAEEEAVAEQAGSTEQDTSA